MSTLHGMARSRRQGLKTLALLALGAGLAPARATGKALPLSSSTCTWSGPISVRCTPEKSAITSGCR